MTGRYGDDVLVVESFDILSRGGPDMSISKTLAEAGVQTQGGLADFQYASRAYISIYGFYSEIKDCHPPMLVSTGAPSPDDRCESISAGGFLECTSDSDEWLYCVSYLGAWYECPRHIADRWAKTRTIFVQESSADVDEGEYEEWANVAAETITHPAIVARDFSKALIGVSAASCSMSSTGHKANEMQVKAESEMESAMLGVFAVISRLNGRQSGWRGGLWRH